MNQTGRVDVPDIRGDLKSVLRFNIGEVNLFLGQVCIAKDLSQDDPYVELFVGLLTIAIASSNSAIGTSALWMYCCSIRIDFGLVW
jgi:hypothetical protein